MTPRLTEADRAKFEALKETLKGVKQADPIPARDPPSLGPLDPMLSIPFEGDLEAVDEDAWFAEPKYDGTRIIFQHLDGEVRAYTRRGVERAAWMPHVVDDAASCVPSGTILDAEHAFVPTDGGTEFIPIHTAKHKLADRDLTPILYCFDILAVDGEWVLRRPLHERKTLLKETIEESEHIQRTPVHTADFQTLYDDLVNAAEEGIMLKRRRSHYYPGVRSKHWQKVKAFTSVDVIAVGYTEGEGTRADTFGALVMSDGEQYRGRVGSGFTADQREALMDVMTKTTEKPYLASKVGRPYTPIEPIVISVKYQEITDSGDFRAPVFLEAYPDRPASEVDPIET